MMKLREVLESENWDYLNDVGVDDGFERLISTIRHPTEEATESVPGMKVHKRIETLIRQRDATRSRLRREKKRHKHGALCATLEEEYKMLRNKVASLLYKIKRKTQSKILVSYSSDPWKAL